MRVCVCVCVCVCEMHVRMCVCSSPPLPCICFMFLTSSPSLSLHLSFRVSENCIGIALQAVHPDYHRMQLNGASRSLNPQPYRAACFGEKLHIDQNEKLVMFGVTHICAIDGWENCSICQHASEEPCTDISTLVQVNSCTNWKLYVSLFLHHKTIQTNTCGVWFI